jgi:hypothetical protein
MNNQNLIELYKNNKHDIISYLLKNNLASNLNSKDSNGNTFLHLIVKDNNLDLLNDTLNWIKQDDNRKNLLNIQNNEGNTVLHIAVLNDNHNIAQLLESYGADRKIENANGDVITATESDFLQTDNYTDIFNDTDMIDNFDTDMPDRLSAFESPDYDDPLFQNVPTSFHSVSDNIQSIDYTAQFGGAQSIVGVRYIDNNDEQLYEYDDMSGGDKTLSKKQLQTDEIRQKVLKKIMKEQKVDELEALVIRAALWKKVKEEFPNISNIDKHKKLEELATKEHIKKLDKKVLKEIKNHIQNKKKEMEKKK